MWLFGRIRYCDYREQQWAKEQHGRLLCHNLCASDKETLTWLGFQRGSESDGEKTQIISFDESIGQFTRGNPAVEMTMSDPHFSDCCSNNTILHINNLLKLADRQWQDYIQITSSSEMVNSYSPLQTINLDVS